MCQPFNGLPCRVAIVMRSDMPYFFFDVAKEIRSRWKAEIHAYCANKDQRDFYATLDRDSVFASLTISNSLADSLTDELPPRDMIVAEARTNEDKLGVTYNRLAVGNRHFGRGYALAGSGHPRSRISNAVTNERLMHAYNRLVSFWREALTSKDIELVIANSADIAIIARSLGIPYRGLFGSRHQNLHYWGDDEYRNSKAISAKLSQLKRQGRQGAEELTEPYFLAQVNRAKVQSLMTLSQTLRQMALQIIRHLYWRFHGYEKARGYYLRDELRLFWNRYRDWRRLTDQKMTPLSALRDKPFVFYALQTEPETQIHQTSPEYFFQMEAIASLSRDLPAGITLVVKETPYGIGRRPVDFYDQILALKNVVMLRIDEDGFAVVQAARAVAVIVGTTGHEAAILGKPVISFGQHNMYGGLPHVFVVKSSDDLRSCIAASLSAAFDSERAKSDGQLFLRAIVECSFDMKNYSYHQKHEFSRTAVAHAVSNLADTLAFECANVTSIGAAASTV